jgi:hypothetical protein
MIELVINSYVRKFKDFTFRQENESLNNPAEYEHLMDFRTSMFGFLIKTTFILLLTISW